MIYDASQELQEEISSFGGQKDARLKAANAKLKAAKAALEKARTALKAAEAAHVAASAEGEAADGEREVLLQQLEATKASVAGAIRAHEALCGLLIDMNGAQHAVHYMRWCLMCRVERTQPAFQCLCHTRSA